MRFSRVHRARQYGDESILPLTNVVFLLLIFFMLAGQISAPLPFEVTPPQSSSEAGAESARIEVQVSAGGAIALEGDRLDLDELGAAVRRRLDDNPDTPVRIRADGGGDATRVVAVMHALHDAGVDKLRLITTTPAGG